MDDFAKQMAMKKQMDEKKDKEYKRVSKERLFKICETKIKTTMIGALESIEKRFAPYWTADDGKKPSNEQLLIKKLYDETRQEILDRGNFQIRSLQTEFEQYEIDWKRYTLILPVIRN